MEHSELKFTKLFQGQVQILKIKKSNTHEIYIYKWQLLIIYAMENRSARWKNHQVLLQQVSKPVILKLEFSNYSVSYTKVACLTIQYIYTYKYN